ncbi:hypothetical protein PYCCODRAFT_619779 [Trametes coccinea BRFM310]|uniref:DUF6534 domain-containing protein n=1 Tax=Trametes coccinea (strain BRFM310) TaxID=1353009 RepID=A0A1Y2J259_TRAC3|nr:hypothetical protein PYCCODRAFT_619779 [Trametes coccinea BRFM310]
MGSPATITYGPIFIGVIFNVLLYGIMITQTYLYFQMYKRDKNWIKLFVICLFVCDTVNCAFDIAFLYMPLVNEFGNVQALNVATWVFATDPAMTAIIAALVQSFFAWRVKVLTRSWVAVGLIAFCSFAQFCGGLGTAIAVGMIPEFVHFQKFQVIVIVWLAFSAVADTLITASLVWHLRRNKTGMPVTDDIINRIVRMTVQTGLVTALCAIIDLILFLATPAGLHLIFNLPLSKLYTNSLMSSLNTRHGWQYDSSQVLSSASQSREHSRGVMPMPRNVNIIQTDRIRRPQPQIFIDVEQHEMVDIVDMKGQSLSLNKQGHRPEIGEKASTVKTTGSDSVEAA